MAALFRQTMSTLHAIPNPDDAPAADRERETGFRIDPVLCAGAWVAALFFNGENFTAFAICLILLSLWLARTLAAARRHGIASGDPWLPLTAFIFLLWLGVDGLFSQVPYLSRLNLFWVGVLPGTFLIAWLIPDRRSFLERTFFLLKLGGIALAGVALWQLLVLGHDPAGTFRTRNSLAALLNMLAFLLLGDVLRMSGRRRILAAVGLFILLVTVGIIQSRGAWLGLATGLVLLLIIDLRRDSLRRWRLPAAVFTAAFVVTLGLTASHPVTGTDVLGRAATLGDVQGAGYTRFVIWAPAWRLFLQHSWLGTGIGTYFMVIPPWLDPADTSAHFYVHNDYLQLLVETGIPGLATFLLLGVAAVRTAFAGLVRRARPDPLRLDLAAALSALASVAVHSLFTFNLYILPGTMLAGLLLARLHALASDDTGHIIHPLAALRTGLFRILLVTIVLFSVWHFGRLALGEQALAAGRRLAAEAHLEQAHARFQQAQRFSPDMDSPWFADADLLRRSAEVLTDRPDMRRGLLEEARRAIDEAIARNPWRPQSHDILARIRILQNPIDPAAERAWQQALHCDPRYLPARNALARHYLDIRRPAAALAVLREGLRYRYPPASRDFAEYLRLLEDTARQQGDAALARTAAERRAELASSFPSGGSGDAH